jgi:predicted transposase YdaD
VQEGPGPRPFDVATRRLIESDPAGWLALAGLPIDGPVHPLDSDVATVLAEVDKVLQVDAPSPWLAHLEVQTTHDPVLPRRMLQYHVLLLHRHDKPVVSTVILLRPEADGTEMSGRFEQAGPHCAVTVTFNFGVVRIWERPVEEFLAGPLGTLPLAPVSAVARDRLPAVIRQMDERVRREASPNEAGEFWASTLLLMGLRYHRSEALRILQRVNDMHVSDTYQMILEEGEAIGEMRKARSVILRLGRLKFGAPDAATADAIEAIDNLAVLDSLIDRTVSAISWEDLLSGVEG